MSDRQALIEVVRANPEEDTPRLVLADWYEENGDPARGEFVRVQCELASLDPASDRYPNLHVRQLQLLAEHEREWLGEWADRLSLSCAMWWLAPRLPNRCKRSSADDSERDCASFRTVKGR